MIFSTSRPKKPPEIEPIDTSVRQCYDTLVFNGILEGLSRLVYPPHCLICNIYTAHSPGPGLCPRCRAKIIFNRPPFCLKCSRHVSEYSRQSHCRECLKTNPAFDFAWGACLYQGPLKDLIHRFKYGQKTLLRGLLGELMASFVRDYEFDLPQFDFIIPIPLSATRLRERGYNQARLLAKEVAKSFLVPVAENHLYRIKHTRPQALLDEKQRWTNIKGAFTIGQPDAVKRKNVLLIDDLLTTGATASEAARTLKDAGAGTVGVLTLAVTCEQY